MGGKFRMAAFTVQNEIELSAKHFRYTLFTNEYNFFIVFFVLILLFQILSEA